MSYRGGDAIPDAPYTEQEHVVWQTIRRALAPAHQKHACSEYLSCLKHLDFDTSLYP